MSETAMKSDDIELTMERDFAHPPEAVFRAWTESDALRQWMGPGEITAPESQIEACQGQLQWAFCGVVGCCHMFWDSLHF